MTRLVQSQGRRSAYSSGSGLARVAWSDVAQYHLCGLRPPAVLQHSSGTKRRPRFKQSLWAQGQTVWVDAPGESVQGHFSLLQCAGALTKTSALLTCTEWVSEGYHTTHWPLRTVSEVTVVTAVLGTGWKQLPSYTWPQEEKRAMRCNQCKAELLGGLCARHPTVCMSHNVLQPQHQHYSSSSRSRIRCELCVTQNQTQGFVHRNCMLYVQWFLHIWVPVSF